MQDATRGSGDHPYIEPNVPPDREPRAQSGPARSYDEALRLVRELVDADTPAVSSVCRTKLMTHGECASHVIVMLHGLTNCPAQFEALGRICFERGANVLIPRLPRHGLADRMTDELARTDEAELRQFTDCVLDTARGLGERVTIVGLSLGGTLAAWGAQNRSDLERAVLIAPMLTLGGIWDVLARMVTPWLRVFPNLHFWWDPRRREKLPGPQHVYLRYAMRAIAATLKIGREVLEQARHEAPRCGSAAIVTVGGDKAVGNRATAALARSWRRHGLRDLTEYEFPRSLHLNHDVVDPEQVHGNPAVTYPVLLRLILP